MSDHMDTNSKRLFLTSLFKSIAAHPTTDPGPLNPLKTFSGDSDSNIRHIFLTLHVLYPNELLPALDLLDRGLIYHLNTRSSEETNNPISEPLERDIDQPSILPPQKQNRIYHVRSAQEPPSWHTRKYAQHQHQSHRTDVDEHSHWTDNETEMRADGTYYETRPYAWNCSCPAFVFSAFKADTSSNERENITTPLPIFHEHSNQKPHQANSGTESTLQEEKRSWTAGGLTTGDNVPVCKHLLACVLVEHCASMFAHFVKQRDVSLEEIVAWGAGWGG